MKLMFLLLEYQICTSSSTVKFLITEPSDTRTYIIFPLYMIYEDNKNSYYDDMITKYFSKFHFFQFETLTYPQYFEKYFIIPLRPLISQSIFHDDFKNYIVKYLKKI